MKFTGKLRNSSSGFRVALTMVALTTTVSVGRTSFNLGYYYHLFQCDEVARLSCYLSMEGSYLLAATSALALSAFGLCWRTLPGRLLSLLALALLVAIYASWYLATLSSMRLFGVPDFAKLPDQPQYLFPLLGATWWDIVVLLIALILIIWLIVTLKQNLKPQSTSARKEYVGGDSKLKSHIG